MSFVSFMGSGAGRVTRIVAGIAMIAVGAAIGGAGGIIIAVVGVVPLGAGAFNVCLLAPLFGQNFRSHSHAESSR